MGSLIQEVSPNCRFCGEKGGMVYMVKGEHMPSTVVFAMCDLCRKEFLKVIKD